MEAREAEAIFQTILDVGVTMLKSGGEVYRVEDTICRLIRAYGGENPHVFAIPSHIVATAEMGGREMTSSRRLMAPCINLEMLDRVNDLARHVCRETPDAKTMRARLEAVEAAPTYTLWQKMFIYALVAFSFTLFFGGNLADAIASALIGVVMLFCARLSHTLRGNTLFNDILSAAVAAALAVTSVRLGLAADADKIIIGNVMLLIPGVELVNGMRDFIARRHSGGSDARGRGAVSGHWHCRGRGGRSDDSGRCGMMKEWLLPIVSAALGSLSFAMFFGVRSRKLWFSLLGGALNWGLYLLAMKKMGLPATMAYALGAAAGTLYAEILARIVKTPVTVFVITSVIPMVPGGRCTIRCWVFCRATRRRSWTGDCTRCRRRARWRWGSSPPRCCSVCCLPSDAPCAPPSEGLTERSAFRPNAPYS